MQDFHQHLTEKMNLLIKYVLPKLPWPLKECLSTQLVVFAGKPLCATTHRQFWEHQTQKLLTSMNASLNEPALTWWKCTLVVVQVQRCLWNVLQYMGCRESAVSAVFVVYSSRDCAVDWTPGCSVLFIFDAFYTVSFSFRFMLCTV